MSEFNPYNAPQSSVEVEHPLELAGRWVRLGASLLDDLIMLIPLALLFGIGYQFFHWDINIFTNPANKTVFNLIAGVLGASCYFAINGKLLASSGQTVGKRLCNIRILKLDGSIPSLRDSFFKRYISLLAVQQIPSIGIVIALIDALMIFRGNHKCLHDEIAQTMVVKVK